MCSGDEAFNHLTDVFTSFCFIIRLILKFFLQTDGGIHADIYEF